MVEETAEVIEVLCNCGCSETLQPYLSDILTVAGHIEAMLWFGVLWLTAFLLYKLIRVFV